MACHDPRDELIKERIVEYVADESVCHACQQGRHKYCISKRGFECWCQEDDAHNKDYVAYEARSCGT